MPSKHIRAKVCFLERQPRIALEPVHLIRFREIFHVEPIHGP